VFALSLPSSIDTEALRTMLVGGVGLFVVMGILSAWVMKTVVMKLISITLFMGLALFAWSQRSAAADCAKKVTSVQIGQTKVTCSIAGFDVNVSRDQLPVELQKQLLDNVKNNLP
jgi:hypothetical protein